jgi:hypothetical protein
MHCKKVSGFQLNRIEPAASYAKQSTALSKYLKNLFFNSPLGGYNNSLNSTIISSASRLTIVANAVQVKPNQQDYFRQ